MTSAFDDCKLVDFKMDNVDDFTSRPQMFKRIDNPSFTGLAKEWRKIRDLIHQLTEHEQALRKALIGLTDGHNVKGGGIIIEKIIRRGNIDYGMIQELADVELERYRKPSTESYRFTLEE